MARPVDESAGITKVVELRAVQPGFPFYGQLTLQDGRPYSHSLLQNNGALVRPELLAQLGLEGRRRDRHRPIAISPFEA